MISAILWGVVVALEWACPFCTAPEPTLAERRESASIVAIVEVATEANDQQQQAFRVHRYLKRVEGVEPPTTIWARSKLSPGVLAVLLGQGEQDNLQWHIRAVDEAGLGYFVHAPSLRLPFDERLAYFIPFLEHANPLIAQDAYAEFGRAPYDGVKSVAAKLPMDKIRGYLDDRSVPDERKGFYGMALGLAVATEDQRRNAELLEQILSRPASDLRAGFDGILGGYLLLAAEPGLERLEREFILRHDAARGDVMHLITALRFYHEFGKQIPSQRLARALMHLAERPEYAATVIVDLARWQAWDYAPRIAALWTRQGFGDRPTRRAIVGYLLNCPTDAGERELAALRRNYPAEVADAERTLSALGSIR